ncbi:MAG: 2OG-Fe(II) oxygenase [Methylobacteriaceae bacterium]|nr:2OG-Fe(II) oxygenase [Methylobacteriaceae bacterium]
MSGAIRRAQAIAAPWPHWRIRNVLPPGLLRGLAQLPLQASIAVQPSGRRAYRNDKRIYFDYANMARFPPMRRIAETMQSPALASTVAETFGAALEHTFLRIEYALDADGFWLEPHTDIGEKKFTCFIYLDGADDLGTDIYADAQTLAYRVPFAANSALAFVPSHDTWHGFAPRPIERVRRSLIVNYVSADWRARAQLSFPDMPVRVAN